MAITWDEAKRRINLAKHKIDLALVAEFRWEEAIEEAHFENDEWRVLAFGPVGERFIGALVYVETCDAVRVISLRKASKRELKAYAEAKA